MNANEINMFIEEMEMVGDQWTYVEVKRVYGKMSLEKALADRKKAVAMHFDIISKVINRK